MSTCLTGKTALVVGAAGGIGAAIAQRFAREGAKVVATSSSGRGSSDGDQAEWLACNLSDPDSVTRLGESLSRRSLDIVVNNAGVGIARARLHEIELDEWDRLMAVNLRGAFLLMKACIPLLLANGGGSFINIASIAAHRATARAGAYCASKGGVLQLTKAAALEYIGDGIRVNAICPGTVRTPLLDRHPPEFVAELSARIPAGRLAEPDEIASLAVFLASDQSAYITGQDYIIDGGRSAG